MIEIIRTLEACEPMELLRSETPENIWIRLEETSHYWPEVSIRGPEKAVYDFIADNWSKDTADAYFYETGPFAK